MLEVYPEKVQSEARLPVRDLRRTVCPRFFESKNCNTNNCPHLHPDFLDEQWTVPNIICHKWFQGCCDLNTYCWNQHGFTFDQALRQALRVQNQLRGGEPPYAYSSQAGGVILQVSLRTGQGADHAIYGRLPTDSDPEVALRDQLHSLLRLRGLELFAGRCSPT